MRFFWIACFFGIVVASIGCMTRNWSTPLFNESAAAGENDELMPFQSSGAMEDQLFGNARRPPRSNGVPRFSGDRIP